MKQDLTFCASVVEYRRKIEWIRNEREYSHLCSFKPAQSGGSDGDLSYRRGLHCAAGTQACRTHSEPLGSLAGGPVRPAATVGRRFEALPEGRPDAERGLSPTVYSGSHHCALLRTDFNWRDAVWRRHSLAWRGHVSDRRHPCWITGHSW